MLLLLHVAFSLHHLGQPLLLLPPAFDGCKFSAAVLYVSAAGEMYHLLSVLLILFLARARGFYLH